MPDSAPKTQKGFLPGESGFTELILESLSEGVCVIDRDGRVIYLNPVAEKMLGWDTGDEVPTDYTSLLFGQAPHFGAEERSILTSPIEFALSEGETSHIRSENFYRKYGASFQVEYICVPLISEGEIRGAVVTFEDVSERQDMEAAMAEARDSALESASVKAAFLANMSHEIRTPLNGIMGIAGLLSETQLTSEQRNLLNVLQNSSKLLLEIINDVLDFSKIEAKRLEFENHDFNLVELLQDTYGLFAPQAEKKGLDLKFELDKAVPIKLNGDESRLRQVLINLIGNALKFTQEGSVKLGVVCEGMDDKQCSLKFEVTDTGIGIPAEKLQAIFEPFTQADLSTSRRFGGSGLGLAISRQLAEMMGGSLGVVSEDGKGSTFWVKVKTGLGSSPQPDITEAAIPSPLATVNTGTRKILIAEDNEVNQIITVNLLKQLGYESVTVVNNGLEALKAVESDDFDLVFMDCLMPEMDGYEASREIRRNKEKSPDIKIVALTASVIEGEREKCIQAGMDDYLAKPFTKKDLKRVLDACLNNGGNEKGIDPGANLFQNPLLNIIEPDKLRSFLEIESGGEDNFLRELLETYLEHSTKGLAEVYGAFLSRDAARLQQGAHSLRGSSANIGLMPLYKEFSDLEEKAVSRDWDYIEKNIDGIIKDFEDTKTRILQIIGSKSYENES